MTRRWGLSYSIVLLLTGPAAAFAQQDFSKVEVTSEKVAEGVYMLKGAGGNIGVSVGDDGVGRVSAFQIAARLRHVTRPRNAHNATIPPLMSTSG